MSINCELRELSTQHVLSVRRRTPVDALPQVIGDAYQTIAKYLASLGEQPAGPPYAAYYNLDMNDLDVELGFMVLKSLPGTDEIQTGRLPGGKAAMVLHVGPYTEVEAYYDALMQWIKGNHYEWIGVAYEFYLNDPNNTPPEELKTEIYLPVKETGK